MKDFNKKVFILIFFQTFDRETFEGILGDAPSPNLDFSPPNLAVTESFKEACAKHDAIDGGTYKLLTVEPEQDPPNPLPMKVFDVALHSFFHSPTPQIYIE